MGLKKLGIVLLLFLLFASPVRAQSATVGDISKQLICQCGCTMVLNNCSHSECMVRDVMTTLIAQKLTEGQSEEQIIQFFAAQYGEQVLSSPPKKGLNLVAWILPFVAILGGGGVIYITLKVWVKRGKDRQVNVVTGAGEEDEEYRHRLEEELDKFNGGSFR